MATTAALANRSARGARSQSFELESRRLEESRSRRLGALAKTPPSNGDLIININKD
jgi:hypothetical protein